MKQTIFLSFLLLSINSYSQEQDPSLFCDQSYECTDTMREISNQYQASGGEFSKDSLIGVSGSCYHISSMYDPNTEHHGAFLFERSGQDLITMGVFSFFAGSDPYQGMNSSELKNWFLNNEARFSKAIEKPTHVELQFLGEGSDYRYWFRENKKLHKVFMIGRQLVEDYAGFIFCDFNQR